MIRFIFICMIFTAISFAVVPAFMSISKQRDILLSPQSMPESSVLVGSEISFEEIYALANEGFDINPAFLNAIAPAAGNGADNDIQSDNIDSREEFPSGFSGKEDSALAL